MHVYSYIYIHIYAACFPVAGPSVLCCISSCLLEQLLTCFQLAAATEQQRCPAEWNETWFSLIFVISALNVPLFLHYLHLQPLPSYSIESLEYVLHRFEHMTRNANKSRFGAAGVPTRSSQECTLPWSISMPTKGRPPWWSIDVQNDGNGQCEWVETSETMYKSQDEPNISNMADAWPSMGPIQLEMAQHEPNIAHVWSNSTSI